MSDLLYAVSLIDPEVLDKVSEAFSSEIRTPMNAVLEMADMALEEDVPEGARECIARIKSSGLELLALINEILDYSEMESGELTITPTVYDPTELLKDVAELIMNRISDKNVELEIDASSDIPRLLSGSLVRIRQVFINIAHNAVKFTSEGKISVRMDFDRISDSEGILSATVSDTGSGIKSGELEKITESFNTPGEEKGISGMGLGLIISQKLLSLMGGRLEVKSEYGKGSVFSFSLKQKIEDPEPAVFEKEISEIFGKEACDSDSFIAPGARILIVDDNIVNLAVAEGLLEPLKMKITAVSSGKEAIEKLKTRRFDIIFLDVMMPDLDGPGTAAKIRKNMPEYEDVPIIALNTERYPDIVERLEASGFSDKLENAFEEGNLIKAVREFLPKEIIKDPSEISEYSEDDIDAQLEQISDLDTGSAIGLIGNKDVYRNILKEYLRVMPQKSSTIREAFENDEWETYTIEVHALKSSSRQIGASALADMAAELEKAGNEKNLVYIHEHTDEMLDKYLSYEPVLASVFGKKKENNSSKKAADPGELKELFVKLREAADNLDSDEMEAISQKLGEYSYPEEQSELLDKITQACADIDVDLIPDLLDKWEEYIR